MKSRRRRAIRSIVILLIVFAAISLTGLYRLLPRLALREAEFVCATGRTEVIHTLNIDLFNRGYLSVNDDVVMFTQVSFTPLRGWMANGSSTFSPDSGDAVTAAGWHLRDGELHRRWVFGCADLPDGAGLTLHICEDYDSSVSIPVPGSDYIESGGRRYFFTEVSAALDEPTLQHIFISAESEDGEVIDISNSYDPIGYCARERESCGVADTCYLLGYSAK